MAHPYKSQADGTRQTKVSAMADGGGIREHAFQRGIRGTQWWKEYVGEYGEQPDLNTPDYDYRAAWKSGSRPDTRDPTDNNRLHWSSQFKGDSHPNLIVDGVNTKTGERVGSSE